MHKQIVLFLLISCFMVLQPTPSFAQGMVLTSAHISISNPTMHFQHFDGYQNNNAVANTHHYGHNQNTGTISPTHHYGENQNSGTTLLHTHNHLWTHIHDVQPDKQQQAQINLDLSSSNANMTAGHLLHRMSVTIDVGGQQFSVTSNSHLTSAEYLAVSQVIHAGNQTIVLNSLGEAVAGTVVINPHLSNELNSLVVPHGVTVVDLTASGKLNLSGGVIDSGNLYVTSFNPSLNNIAINTNNISVQSGATFSNIVSAHILPWLTRADVNLNLNLNSATNINNAGTISSGGSLNLTAGSGNITNTGLIHSINGSINVTVPSTNAAQTLSVNSTGGTWQATNGNINFSCPAVTNTSATGTSNLNLVGGDYLSQQLNTNLGSGALSAAVQNVTGVVSVTAGKADLMSTASNLQVGSWNISGGDPTIASSNTITLAGNIVTDGAPLTIVSGQDIVSFNPITINTSSLITSGGNINIIAGASFTPNPYSSGNISILGSSATGGSINLNLINNGINSQGLSANNGGGNVVLAAFAGGAAGSGKITLPSSSTIYTGGSGNGSPGHVFVIAGANTGSASASGISIGIINTVSSNESGGPGGSGLAGGHIVLANEQPNASISNPWIIDPSNGTSLVGGPLGGATADAPISFTGINTGGGQVIVFSGLGITVGNNSTIGTNVISTVPAGGTTFPGGEVTLIANAYGSTAPSVITDIVINGNIITSGPSANAGTPESGNVIVMTTGSVTIGNITTSNAASTANSTGGSVYIVAGTSTTAGNITTGNINTSSQNASAGFVELISMGTTGGSAGAVSVGAISSYSTNSNGAPITISSPGTITIAGAIDSQGGNGNGGSLFIGSGAQSGTAISAANGLTINTFGTNRSGGVYLLAANAADTITYGTITTVPIEVISAYNPLITSITGGAGMLTINLGTSVGTSLLSDYRPGGYFQLNDQIGTPGGVTLALAIPNGDPNVLIPFVSLNSSLTLLGAPGSSSAIDLSTSSTQQAGYSLLSSNGIFVGGSNASLFAFLPFRTYLGIVASNRGTVNLNNSNGGILQQMSVGLAASASGPLAIVNGAALNISNTISASSVTLGSGILVSGLILSGSVSSASAITLFTVGSNVVNVAQNGPGTIGGATLNIVNISTFQTFSTDVTYLNVETSPNSTVSISNASDVNVSVPQVGSFYLSSAGQINLTGASVATAEFSLSSNADLAISHNIAVNGPSARIDLKSGNTIIVGDGVSVNAIGTSNAGGLVQLAFSVPNGPLSLINNGIIEASNTNNSSVVGLNSGSSLYINVTGSGAIAGSQVNFGNLNSTTLQMQGPFQLIASPLIGGFSYGNIYVQQGLLVASTGFISVSAPLISSASLTLLNYNQHQNILYEQIGTRIPTDYTPWTTYPMQPQLYKMPLQGNISMNQSMKSIGEALFAANEFNATEQSMLVQQGIVFGPSTKGNFFDLVKGYMLFMPTNNISVQTREGLVQIPKGAQVWVMETGADVAIYDLHDDLITGFVKVIVNNSKKEFILSPGKELLLTRNSQESFATLNPGKDIAYRSVHSTDAGAGIKAYVADFSITQGMKNIGVINNLLRSNDPTQRKAARRMMKNATILADLTGGGYAN